VPAASSGVKTGRKRVAVCEIPVPEGPGEAMSEGVTAFQAGDRVVMSCLVCCGTCRRCMDGDHQVC